MKKIIRFLLRCIARSSSFSFKRKFYHHTIATKETYLISDRSGIYLMSSCGLKKIINGSCFGMTISEDGFLYYTIFLNFCDIYKMSFILRVNINRLICKKFVFSEVVYRREEYSIGSRIHQIECSGHTLCIANSGNNTVLVLDRKTGKKIREFAPFKDIMDKNITGYDFHHINSVAAFGETLLFTAFNIHGGFSVVGLITPDQVELYAYPHEGVHDVALIDQQVFISDSFGGNIPRQGQECDGGFPLKNGQKYLAHFFTEKKYMVRGIGQCEGELILGLSSLFAKEKDVEKNKGGCFIFKEKKGTFYENLPFSQCYDVLNIKGFKIAPENRSVSPEKITDLLQQSFGRPFQTMSIHEVTI